ncbi:hypothetical protein [Paraburkholderia unamae]|uniref:Uncharacterized protein n=1 Tax=Paraburkholderia unamae TaxID=219649 RepID=A0ABX5KFK4_9BURK|nr:hypothetical protein [Paraburkholderia unamae]PVX77161.1 hypothetical protein C7402_115220 [Paraburkholderia unamae]
MSIADQFSADATAGGTSAQQPVSLSQQFAADAAAGAKATPRPPSPQTPAAQGSQPGMLASLGAGLGHGLGETALGAQQLLGRGLTTLGSTSVGPWLSQDAQQGIANLNSQYAPYSAAHPIVAGAGNIGGQVAGTAPLAMAAPEMAGMGLLGRAGVGAGLGAASGAVSPVENPGDNFWQQKAGQIGLNAAVGGIATPVAAGLGSAVSGVTDPLRQKLAGMGINMTPGQIAGGGWQTLENKASSLPLIGDMIKGAQQRGVQSFNRATYDQVLEPLGQTYSGPLGQEGVSAVKKTVSDAYNNALGNMTFRATDPQFQADITNLTGLAQGLPAAQQRTFMNTLQTQVFGKLGPQGLMDGSTLQGAQSELGRLARGYSGDASFDNRQLGSAIGEIKSAIDASLPRYNAPDAVTQKAAADAAYANYVRLRGAAASKGAMDNGGIFTPAQLQGAVRANDKSVGKGASATGNALMQDFSQDAMNVLGKGYPDSGTAGRLGTAGAIGALFSHPGMLLSPWTYAAAAPALAYTPMGQRLAQGLLMSRPAFAQPIGNAITNRLAPLTPGLLGASLQSGSQ